MIILVNQNYLQTVGYADIWTILNMTRFTSTYIENTILSNLSISMNVYHTFVVGTYTTIPINHNQMQIYPVFISCIYLYI